MLILEKGFNEIGQLVNYLFC